MSIINTLLESIFPERADAKAVRACTSEKLRSLVTCQHTDNVVALLPYTDAIVRALIHETKFHHNERAVRLLGAILKDELKKYPASLVVPIPLSAKRRKQRGYNQIELLLKPIVRETGHVYAPQYLKRTRDTAPQTSLNRTARLHNLKDAFVVPEKYTEHIRGAHIIVVDDVTTTGATLKAARATLAPHQPASLTCVAVAH